MTTSYKRIFQSIRDAQACKIPKHLSSLKKIETIHPQIGTRIGWYYKEDLEFYKQEKLSPRKESPYSGIVIPAPDIEYRGEINPENCVVVVDQYPCEKCYPECDWVSLFELIDNDDLVEVFEIK